MLRRVGFYAFAFWAAVSLNFALPRLMPGNPADVILLQMERRQPVTDAQRELILRLFGGSDEPWWSAYISYWNNVIHLDFGTSIAYFPVPVRDVISDGIWWTVGLLGFCTVVSFAIGTSLGILLGWRPGSLIDRLVTPSSIVLASVPYFWFALMLALGLSVHLGWFPLSGGWDPNVPMGFTFEFIASAAKYAVLPALSIVLTSFSGWLIGMRNMMLTSVHEDYVLLARAKGLPWHRVMFGYAARNAILPSVSSFAMSIGFIVGGSLLTETVFAYPGIGTLFVQAIKTLDYPLMQALFLMITLAVLVANFVADSIYVLIDPRTREGS
ncbi:peptide ABC transporter permease [Luteipulveratus mongoliensis]|uniref:Peptide ABC transporter permease n=1 Tax=Luteipulveratus mongoliensis TaxID=571913 RepID=A0A0K1JR38_9MICO|nr:peptide ABC transporter permease [Luteipulveratus mongoliensis]